MSLVQQSQKFAPTADELVSEDMVDVAVADRGRNIFRVDIEWRRLRVEGEDCIRGEIRMGVNAYVVDVVSTLAGLAPQAPHLES